MHVPNNSWAGWCNDTRGQDTKEGRGCQAIWETATYCCNVFGPCLHILSLKYIHLFCEKQTKIYRSGFVFFKFYSVQIHLPHCSRTDSEPQPVLGRGNKMLSWFWMSYVLFHCSPLVWTEGTFNSAGCFCLVRAAATVSLRPGVLRVMTLFTLSDIEEVK